MIEREARELGNKRDARSRLGRYLLKDDLAGRDLHGPVELESDRLAQAAAGHVGDDDSAASQMTSRLH